MDRKTPDTFPYLRYFRLWESWHKVEKEMIVCWQRESGARAEGVLRQWDIETLKECWESAKRKLRESGKSAEGALRKHWEWVLRKNLERAEKRAEKELRECWEIIFNITSRSLWIVQPKLKSRKKYCTFFLESSLVYLARGNLHYSQKDEDSKTPS